MKKVIEFCPECRTDTTHRKKRKSLKSSAKKEKGYSSFSLLLKCMTCGYLHGIRIDRKTKRSTFIRI